MKMSEEIKQFIEEHKKNISLSLIGNKRNLGHHHSKETKERMSLALKGKKKPSRTEEHKKNLSLAKKREWQNPEFRKRMSEAHKGKFGEKSSNWKGDIAKQSALHRWLRKHKPKSQFCEFCGKEKDKNTKLELANIKNHNYTRNLYEWKWVHRSCHRKFDLNNKSLKGGI